jgi:hypothetical protein
MRGDPPSDGSGNNGACHYQNRYPKKIGLSDVVRVVEQDHHPETEQDRLDHHKDHNGKRETDFCVFRHQTPFADIGVWPVHGPRREPARRRMRGMPTSAQLDKKT